MSQKINLVEFMKISRKYGNDHQFLKKTLEIFIKFQQPFNNNYVNFLEMIEINQNNYKKILHEIDCHSKVIHLFPEFKKE